GMLARQRDIENLRRDLKARQLLADEAAARVNRAESAWQQASQAVGPARQRVAELTRRLHDVELQHTRLAQQAEQSDAQAARLREDIHEIAAQVESLHEEKAQAEDRFQELDGRLADVQQQFADAELAGEALQREVEDA